MPDLNPSALLARLTIGISLISVCVLLLVATGPGLAIAILLAAATAFVLWIVTAENEATPRPVVPYLGVVISALVLATGRYLSGFAAHLHELSPALFNFAPLDMTTMWLLADVIMPVTVMLFGGYWWLSGHAGGRYFPWLVCFYGAGDALVQLAVEFLTPAYNHGTFLGAIAAVSQLTFSAIGLLSLLGRAPASSPSERPVPSARTIKLWTVLFAAFGVGYGATLFAQAGPLPVGVIVGSMLGGLVGWRRTTARHPAEPARLLLPLYLLMLALFYIHVGEETLTSFNRAIALITGKPWADADFTVLIALLGPALWVLAGVSLWLRQAFGNFILWFMILGMILGEPTHVLIFPVLVMLKTGGAYSYFSGMATSLFPMIPAVLALVTLVSDARGHRGAARLAVA